MLDIVPISKQFLTNLRAAVGSEAIKQLTGLQQKLEGHVGLSLVLNGSHGTVSNTGSQYHAVRSVN